MAMPSCLFPLRGFAAAFLAAATLGALGCGRPESAADRQFAELREQVDKIERDRDTIDQRIGALEVAVADEKGDAKAAQPRNVVQLGGPVDGEGEDPNEKGERPDIRVTGAGGGGVAPVRARSGKSGRARIEESELPAVRPDAARSSALDPDAKASYEAALALVQGRQYDRGVEGLSAFLARWPDHPYAENAIYWRGEAYFAQGEYLRAGEQFEAVMARFGSGKKAPDALLKLGMCQDRLGASTRAREYWERLKTEYPKSEAAKRIPSGSRDSGAKGPKENR
jgi:tol-pal system protein YbgF